MCSIDELLWFSTCKFHRFCCLFCCRMVGTSEETEGHTAIATFRCVYTWRHNATSFFIKVHLCAVHGLKASLSQERKQSGRYLISCNQSDMKTLSAYWRPSAKSRLTTSKISRLEWNRSLTLDINDFQVRLNSWCSHSLFERKIADCNVFRGFNDRSCKGFSQWRTQDLTEGSFSIPL